MSNPHLDMRICFYDWNVLDMFCNFLFLSNRLSFSLQALANKVIPNISFIHTSALKV